MMRRVSCVTVNLHNVIYSLLHSRPPGLDRDLDRPLAPLISHTIGPMLQLKLRFLPSDHLILKTNNDTIIPCSQSSPLQSSTSSPSHP